MLLFKKYILIEICIWMWEGIFVRKYNVYEYEIMFLVEIRNWVEYLRGWELRKIF